MSICPILTFPQLLLLFGVWKWTTLTAYGNILKIPKKMLQLSIFHFYSGARKKSGQYWYGHHMMILEEHKNPKKMLWFSLFFTSPTLFRGWEWTILVAALQRLLKKPPQTHIMYVFMCADQSRWIGRITKVCTLYATHFGSVTFSS